MKYDPAIHNRRSIRLESHDYSAGGLYFVTLCAHREFIAATQGCPFGSVGARPASPSPASPSPASLRATQVSQEERATQVSPVRDLIEERMQITAEKCPWMRWEEAVIMPDHFHALIRMEGGHAHLGDVVGGFKAAVTRELRRRRGEACLARACLALGTDIRIWHRNYYEMIVRTAEAEANIRNYIRANPWKCIMDFGNGLRGMGNPSLWNRFKLGVLCSRRAPPIKVIPPAEAYLSGFHSPPEKRIMHELLKRKANVIICPAWGLNSSLKPDVTKALEENRMLILEMKNRDGNLAAAEDRNRYVLHNADDMWIPRITPGGMLDRLVKEMGRP